MITRIPSNSKLKEAQMFNLPKLTLSNRFSSQQQTIQCLPLKMDSSSKFNNNNSLKFQLSVGFIKEYF